VFRAALAVAFAVFALLAAACGGGSSPSEPSPSTLSVAGTWEGFWTEDVASEPEQVSLTVILTQPSGSTRVTGRVLVFGQTWDISGETTYGGPGAGTFVWDDDETVCPVLSGDLDIAASTNMGGPARLDGRDCPEDDFFDGRMQLRKRAI
jgi:hypothetical protein